MYIAHKPIIIPKISIALRTETITGSNPKNTTGNLIIILNDSSIKAFKIEIWTIRWVLYYNKTKQKKVVIKLERQKNN